MKVRSFSLALLCAVLLSTAIPALATPELQIYVQGGTYNTTSASWEPSTTGPLVLWLIGNISGAGGKGAIEDVSLVIAYDHGLAPSLSLTGTTTGNYAGYSDPSKPSDVTAHTTSTSGTAIPTLGDGSPLPSHGEYGNGTDWQEFSLGNFANADSPCGDFINNGGTAIPTPTASTGCQINAYVINVSGVPDGTGIHFDLFNHVQAQDSGRGKVKVTDRYVFAPFSHDADGTFRSVVPEPASMTFLGTGLAMLLGLRRRRV